MEKTILLVDDEEDILKLLSYNFEKEGFIVYTASNGEDAVRLAMEVVPKVILLDVMLPDIDGIEVCERLRKKSALDNSFILFLSARGEDYAQVAGYRAGGDDYILKPISPRVLRHKVTALLERNVELYAVKEVKSEGIQLDFDRFLVRSNNSELIIPKKEFELLAFLMSVPDKVFGRAEILASVWGSDVIGNRTIDVHVRKLRERFGNSVIRTVKGVGYRFMG